mgnify:CR=1 FL=1
MTRTPLVAANWKMNGRYGLVAELGAALAAAEAALGREGLTRHPLGPSLGQCCGGAVVLLTEHFDAARVAALRSGQVDTISRVAPQRAARLQAEPSLRLQDIPGKQYYGFSMQTGAAPFDALQIRHQHIRRPQIQHPPKSVARVFGLSAGDRRVKRRRDSGEAFQIPRRQRLFKPEKIELLQRTSETDGLALGQALVRIRHQANAWSDNLSHQFHARYVCGGV